MKNLINNDTAKSIAKLNKTWQKDGTTLGGGFTKKKDVKNWFNDSGLEETPFGFQFGEMDPIKNDNQIYDPNSVLNFTPQVYGDAYKTIGELPIDYSAYQTLAGQLGEVGDAYDTSGTLENFNEANDLALLTGVQGAQSAAQAYRDQSLPGTGGDIAAKMLRAKAMLPVMAETRDAKTDMGKYQDDAKQKSLKQSTDIASQLANLHMDYTKTLANYNSQRHQTALQYTNGVMDAERSQTGARIADADRNYEVEMANRQDELGRRNQVYEQISELTQNVKGTGANNYR